MPRTTKQKLGVLISTTRSSWTSCNSISANLIRAYEKLMKDGDFEIEWFQVAVGSGPLGINLDGASALTLAQDLRRARITDVVFLDHDINPLPILIALKILGGVNFNGLRFAFHIYGDFTLFPGRWLDIGNELLGIPVKMICASQRQQDLLTFFEPKDKSATLVCPFPVNTKTFLFSEESRREIRKKLRLSQRDVLILYTGRISLQKGVLRLIEEFQKLHGEGRDGLHLAIAGTIDDLGGLTSGIVTPAGYLFNKLNNLLTALPKRVRERIFFLGGLETAELKKVYSAADLFVSLSLHHDEDFGMSPAEALSSGLPSILTDWGGYASFAIPHVPCDLVPVRLSTRGLEIDAEVLSRQLRARLESGLSTSPRRHDGEVFAQNFGISAVAAKLKAQLQDVSYSRCAGFNWHLKSFYQAGHLQGGLYKEVYGRYVKSPAH